MSGFVITYHRRTGATEVQEYAGPTGPRDALQRRLELEGTAAQDVEIVSLVSDSIETVRQTHSRYFQRELAAS
ncbi:hypothetical protein ACFUMH_05260 [Cellulomonas sp. NPDC057328]|uniref:hypothetical protein n=1 Tax=Cellulomonas sp. NPDC057328 TaxID=3346101 RepID=UPI003636169F